MQKIKTAITVVLLVLVSFSSFSMSYGDASTFENTKDWYDDNWLYSKKLVLNSSLISGSLSDFPVLLNISDSDLTTYAQNDGDDIIFVDEFNSTKFSHDVDSYSSGDLVTWVNLGNINSSEDKTIYMYYGNQGVSAQEDKDGTWPPRYSCVYHLTDINDSSGNNRNMTNNGVSSFSNGLAGGCYDWEHSEDDYMTIPDFSDYAISNEVTIILFLKPESLSSGGSDRRGIYDEMEIGTNDRSTFLREDSDHKFDFFISEDGGSTNQESITGSTTLSTGSWQFVSVSFDNDTGFDMYLDDTHDNAGTTLSGINDCDRDKYLGVYKYELDNQGSHAGVYDGLMDEVFILSEKVSDDYINTTRDIIKNQNSFVTLGDQNSKPDAPVLWYDGWSYCKTLTVNSSMVSGSNDNFTVLVDTTIPDTSHAQENGEDFVFTLDNISKLNHEIEKYDNSSGNLISWVKLPNVNSTSDQKLYMYYGNQSCSSQENVTSTWNSNYIMVHHFEETDIDGGSGDIKDSTSNSNDGTTHNMDSNDQINGVIGGCFDFDGSNDYISQPTNTNDGSVSQIAVSFWARPSNEADAHKHIFSSLDGSHDGFLLELDRDNTIEWATYDGNHHGVLSGQKIKQDEWWYLTYYYDSSDGYGVISFNESGFASHDTSSDTTWITDTQNEDIGRRADGVAPFPGALDEFRVSSSFSEDWINTSFNTMNNQDTFIISDNERDISGYTGAENPPDYNAWDVNDWSYHERIVINHSKVDEPLTNYPMMFKNTSSDFITQAQADGDDFVFSTEDNSSQYWHEIENYNSTSGEFIAWANITSVSNTTDTVLYLHWGNSNCGSMENVTGTWNSNYKGIWHLSETGSSTNRLDSTIYDNTMSTNNFDGDEGTIGKIGGCNEFDGNDDFLSCSSSDSLNLGTDDITVTAWFTADSFNENRIWCYGDGDRYEFYHRVESENDVIEFAVDDGTTKSYKEISANGMDNGEWYYLTGQRDYGNKVRIRVNDNNWNEIDDTSGDASTTTGGKIGNYYTGNYEWDGKIDEVRVSNIIRSEAWLNATYNNIVSPDTFYTFGTPPEEEPVTWYDGWDYCKTITINSSLVSGNLSNYPVFIDVVIPDTSHAQNDGDDFVFTLDNVSKFNHEIEDYNSSNGQVCAWVNLSELSNSTNKIIYMYYGNQTCPSQENVLGTWNSNFEGVYHFNGDGEDSTWKHNASEFNNPTYSTEQVGGYSICYGNGGYETGATTPYSLRNNAKTMIRYEQLGSPTGDSNAQISLRENGGWGVSAEGTLSHSIQVVGTNPSVSGSTSLVDGLWYHLTATHDGGTGLEVFVNGTTDGYSSSGASGEKDRNLGDYLGSDGDGNGVQSNFDSNITELQIMNIVASDDWIKTSANNIMYAYEGGFYSSDNERDESGYTTQPSVWNKCLQINIESDLVDENLTNFPLLVVLNSTVSAECDNGDSIRFNDSTNTTEFAYEIEGDWNSSGTNYVHVNVTSVSSTNDTIVWMRYNNSQAVDAQNPEGVWDSNYVMVQHMDGTTLYDSTSNNNDVTGDNGDPSYNQDGKVGKLVSFDGTDDYLIVSDDDTLSFGDGSADTGITFLALANISSGNSWIVGRRESSTPEYMWGISSDASSNKIRLNTWDDSPTNYLETDSTNSITKSKNQIFTTTYNGNGNCGSVIHYMDGSSISSGCIENSYTAMHNKNIQLRIGDCNDYGPMTGTIDELRISKTNRSEAWIKTSYDSINQTPGFVYFGQQPEPPENNVPNVPTNPQCDGGTNPDHVLDHTPEFSWTFSDDDIGDTQAGYTLQVGDDNNWTNGIEMWHYNVTSTDTSVNYSGVSLLDGITYYWHVKTKDNNGAWGDYCSTQQFRMNSIPVPTLTNPVNGSTNMPYTTKSINLTWICSADDEGDSLNYEFQYARDLSFTQGEVHQWSTGLLYHRIPATGDLYEEQDYYWHVRAWDGLEYGEWSQLRTFETDAYISMSGFSIADGETDVSLLTEWWNCTISDYNGNFRWSIETGPDIGNASAVNETDGVKSCPLTSEDLLYDTEYTVYVNVTGSQRNATYNFRTEDNLFEPQKPIDPYPAQSTGYQSVYNNYLNATILDRDGLVREVTVYWSNDTSIADFNTTFNNSKISVYLPNHGSDWLEHDTTYEWYVKVNDSEFENQSILWNFTTSHYTDINEDTDVNYIDVSSMSSNYRNTCDPGQYGWDILENGKADYMDVSALVSDYGNSF